MIYHFFSFLGVNGSLASKLDTLIICTHKHCIPALERKLCLKVEIKQSSAPWLLTNQNKHLGIVLDFLCLISMTTFGGDIQLKKNFAILFQSGHHTFKGMMLYFVVLLSTMGR